MEAVHFIRQDNYLRNAYEKAGRLKKYFFYLNIFDHETISVIRLVMKSNVMMNTSVNRTH